MVFPGGTSSKELICQCGRHRDTRLIPGLGKSPGGGHGNPFQCFCLVREDWRATVHTVTQSQTQLKRLSTQAHRHLCVPKNILGKIWIKINNYIKNNYNSKWNNYILKFWSLKWGPHTIVYIAQSMLNTNTITSQRDKGATPPSQGTQTSLAVKNDNTREKKRPKDHICTDNKPNNKRRLLGILTSSCWEARLGVMKCHSLSSAIPRALMSNLSDSIILYILYYNLPDISTVLTVFFC